MRLLHTTTRIVKPFNGNYTPPYAILSHTWGQSEVSFQDISGKELNKHSTGYQKIDNCCKQAFNDGYEYVWIDTCCIDNTSSAELSEAINSMFRWYKEADVCYVFLSDVNTKDVDPESQFAKSRWFTRGWTLQELIAPSEMVFYDSGWLEIGTKLGLREDLSNITGISSKLLCGGHSYEAGGSCEDYSIACRMSWASGRVTTRVEDTAYCLMGIFGVNMPLLYGEGEKSFLRLQQEIMKSSDDHSIFAWTSPLADFGGMLAPSPKEFSDSGSVEQVPDDSMSPPFSFTNKGVQVTLPLVKYKFISLTNSWDMAAGPSFVGFKVVTKSNIRNLATFTKVALLNCQLSNLPGQRLGIVLFMHKNRHAYNRYRLSSLLISPQEFSISKDAEIKTIFIRSSDMDFITPHLGIEHFNPDLRRCDIRTLPLGFSICEKYPTHAWTYLESNLCLKLTPKASQQNHAVLLFQGSNKIKFAVLFQARSGGFYVRVRSCWTDEDRKKIVKYCYEDLELVDCVTHKLSESEVVLVNIRKCLGGHMAHISIRSDVPTFSFGGVD